MASNAAKQPTNDRNDLLALQREVEMLRGAIALLHRISILVGGELELEPSCYAVLTATTAGVGLGLNRAMLFLTDPSDRRSLRGIAAIGPADREEADRVWKSIEAEDRDLEALYEAGLRHHKNPGNLDRRVRATSIEGASDTPVALAFRRGEPIIACGHDDASGLFHLPTAIAAPLRDARGICGVLYADNCFTGLRLQPAAELVFRMVADHAGRAITNARRYEEVAGAARTDALTGLGHHGAFMSDLHREVVTALEQRRALGLVMIDLDGFKQINDLHGHLAGDALLVALSARMRGVLRGGEGLYRYGGDEFAALIPGADQAATTLVGKRLRAAVSEQPFALTPGLKLHITCSVGVGSLPEDADDATRLIEATDHAMFSAKASGKDTVRSVHPPSHG